MAWDSKEIADLNNAMTANQNPTPQVGTLLAGLVENGIVIRGEYTVVDADVSASACVIDSGMDSASESLTGYIIQVQRSNTLTACDAVLTVTQGVKLSVANGSSYKLTKDDVISYIMW